LTEKKPCGKSNTTADLAPEPSTSTATHPQDRQKQRNSHNKNDKETILQDESVDEDWEAYRQRCLTKENEIYEVMAEQETIVPGFRPLVKSINSCCVITRDRIFIKKLLLNMHIFMHSKIQKYAKNMQKNFFIVR